MSEAATEPRVCGVTGRPKKGGGLSWTAPPKDPNFVDYNTSSLLLDPTKMWLIELGGLASELLVLFSRGSVHDISKDPLPYKLQPKDSST